MTALKVGRWDAYDTPRGKSGPKVVFGIFAFMTAKPSPDGIGLRFRSMWY